MRLLFGIFLGLLALSSAPSVELDAQWADRKRGSDLFDMLLWLMWLESTPGEALTQR